MKLTPKNKQQFIDWLKSIGVNIDIFQCNICAGRDFVVLDDVVYLHTATHNEYPNIGITCTTCNHINLFNVDSTKILDNDNKTDFGITCQKCFDAEATMQADDGEYLCSECYNHE